MFNLLSPYQLYIKLFGALALRIGTAYGVHHYDSTQFTNYKQAQAILVQKSELDAKNKENENVQTSFAAAEAYTGRITTLESKLAWMRQHPADSGTNVPQAPNSGQVAADTGPEFGRTCTRGIYENALRDAEQLNSLIDNLAKLGIKENNHDTRTYVPTQGHILAVRDRRRSAPDNQLSPY